jgi:pseudouridine synthase
MAPSTRPASGLLTDDGLQRLPDGVTLRDGPTRRANVRWLGDAGGKTTLQITLTEGRNRQVRRMIEAVGARVVQLTRVKVGPIALGDLPPGKWRPLQPEEIASLIGRKLR